MMKQNYSILDENGYLLVPVEGKIPLVSGWTKFQQNDPLWPQNFPNKNIGIILTTNLVAIDVDVMDNKCSNIILKNIIDTFGEDILVRVGKAPKFLALFKVGSGDVITKHKLHLKHNNVDYSSEQAVEILGSGQQVVAYGIHPDTGKRYQWAEPWEPINTHIDDLTVITLSEIRNWLDNLHNFLPDGWNVTKIDGLPQKKATAPVTNYPAVVSNSNKSQKLSKDDIILLLRNINADSYDVWIRVGMALHDYYNQAQKGLDIWDSWSYGSYKYKTGECDKHWYSFYKKDNPVSIAYIVKLSNDYKKANNKHIDHPACIQKIACGDYPKKVDFSVLSNILIDYNQSHNLNDDNLKNEFCENHKSTRKSYSENLKEFDNQLNKHPKLNFSCEYVRTSGIDSIKMCINCPKSKSSEYDGLVVLHEKIPNFSLNCPDSVIRGNGISLQSTIRNLEYLLSCYNIICQYDEILKRQSMIFPPNDTNQINADLEDEAKLRQIISLAVLNELPPQTVDNLISIFAQNTINPVMTWIESREWDGIDRIGDLLSSVELEDEVNREYMQQMVNVWLIQCFAALDNAQRSPVRNAIPKFELCLVFSGRQGAGKTTWFKSLLPVHLAKYFLEGVSLKLKDKDSKKHAISGWIVELGELDATFRNSDIAEIKSFFSSTKDTIRLPYGKLECNFARRTVFCGSVNESGFLHDMTGNRRFVPIAVVSCKKPKVDLQQLWAQIRQEYLNGAKWWLSSEQDKMLQSIQQLHKSSSLVVESLDSRFDLTPPSNGKKGIFITITSALQKAGFDNPKRIEIAEARNYIESLGFTRKKNNVWGYYLALKEG